MSAAQTQPAKSTSKPDKTQTRLGGMDILRFLMAVAVVVGHYTVMAPTLVSTELPQVDSQWMAVIRYFVHGFFMISGFAIMYTIKGRGASGFFVSRMSRILPAIPVCALITYIATRGGDYPGAPGGLQLLASMTVFPLGFEAALGADWAYWTITYELRFYLMVLIALCFMDVRAARTPLLAGWLAISLSDAVFPGNAITHFMALDYYAGCFIIGALTFTIWESRGLEQKLSWAMLPFAFLLTTLQLGAENDVRNWAHEQVPMEDLTEWLVPPIAWGLLVGSLLISRTVEKWPLLGKLAMHLGAMTFPLYLLHQAMGYRIMKDMLTILPDGYGWVATVTAALVGIALSFLIALKWEPWARKKIVKALTAAQTAAVGALRGMGRQRRGPTVAA